MKRLDVLVPRVTRQRAAPPIKRPHCTWCGGPLVDAIAMNEGRLVLNALACEPCGELGVRCRCERQAA